jgi:hypothetical protein
LGFAWWPPKAKRIAVSGLKLRLAERWMTTILRERADTVGDAPTVWTAGTMFDVVPLVSDPGGVSSET